MMLIPIVVGYSWYNHQKIGTETRGLRNKRTSGDHPNYSINNTETSPGDLRRLAVTQTSVEDHQLTLVLKTLPLPCARNLNWTIRTNGICTTQHLS